MTKRQLEQLEKKNARIEKRYQKLEEKVLEKYRKKKAKDQKKFERRLAEREKERNPKVPRSQKLPIPKPSKDPFWLTVDPEKFKGYYFDHATQKYRVQFRFAGKAYRLGLFLTPEEAHASYLEERAKAVEAYKKEAEAYQRELET